MDVYVWNRRIRIPLQRHNVHIRCIMACVELCCCLSYNWPDSTIVTVLDGRPDCEPNDSIFLTTSMPSNTTPNTVCLPSNHGVDTGDARTRKRTHQ